MLPELVLNIFARDALWGIIVSHIVWFWACGFARQLLPQSGREPNPRFNDNASSISCVECCPRLFWAFLCERHGRKKYQWFCTEWLSIHTVWVWVRTAWQWTWTVGVWFCMPSVRTLWVWTCTVWPLIWSERMWFQRLTSLRLLDHYYCLPCYAMLVS
jgi:hypothetical protein